MPRLWAYLLLFSAVGALRQPLIGTRHRRPRRARWAPPHPSPPPLSSPRRAHEKGSTTVEIDVPKAGKAAIKIKPAKFHNLRAVSRLLVQEFYGSTLWYPAQCLVELNRLQENFHSYGDDAGRHVMLLATSLDDGSLVGFVDVDGRDKRPGQTGVRPYLSDLAVAHRCRRMGIGTELVKACEQFCVGWGYDDMYLKVRVGNVAAQKMYENLGYVVHSSSEKQSDGVGSGFMVETGENPKEVMLWVDLAARARAAAESTSQAEEGVVRADSESESESESESDKQELSSVIREG